MLNSFFSLNQIFLQSKFIHLVQPGPDFGPLVPNWGTNSYSNILWVTKMHDSKVEKSLLD